MKILIIQIRQLGDVLLSTPIAECIKKNLNDSEVHFLTSKNAFKILKGNPFIDKIHLLGKGIANEFNILKSIRKEKFDAIIDVQRTGRSKRLTGFSGANLKIGFKKNSGNKFYNKLIDTVHTGYVVSDRLNLLKGIDIFNCENVEPYFHMEKNDFDKANIFLENNNLKKYILFAPTARRIRKMIPPNVFADLANELCSSYGANALITYGENEKETAKLFVENLKIEYVLPDKPFDIKIFGALVKNAFMFVGNNSFSSHIALTQNTKSLIFSGPEIQWFPKNKKNCVIICKYENCENCPFENRCKKDKEENDYLWCFKEININDVTTKVFDYFGKI